VEIIGQIDATDSKTPSSSWLAKTEQIQYQPHNKTTDSNISQKAFIKKSLRTTP
jgi:hypothetical protein